jgi:hypothetical protein
LDPAMAMPSLDQDSLHLEGSAQGPQRLLPAHVNWRWLPGLAPRGNTGGTARLKSSRIGRSLTSVQGSLTHAAKRFGKTVKLWHVDASSTRNLPTTNQER